MKTLKCDLCDHQAQGETFEAWLNVMKSHYAAAHGDVMAKNMQGTPEEKQAGMQKWMSENRARFDAA